MDTFTKLLQAFGNYDAYIFFVISTEILARCGMGLAFSYKKNKRRLKKEEKQRSKVYKIFGLYNLSQTHAPHHMKKYAVIRICNVISLIFTTAVYLFVPQASQLQLFYLAMVGLHVVFLFGPLFVEGLLFRNSKKCGRGVDFDQTRKP